MEYEKWNIIGGKGMKQDKSIRMETVKLIFKGKYIESQGMK